MFKTRQSYRHQRYLPTYRYNVFMGIRMTLYGAVVLLVRSYLNIDNVIIIIIIYLANKQDKSLKTEHR